MSWNDFLTMNPPTKSERAAAIAKAAEMIGEHYGIAPQKMFTDVLSRSAAVREARSVLIYHLHRCGMSFEAIGRIVGRSAEHCQRTERHGVIRLMGEDRAMIDALPQIPTGLNITHA